MQRIAMRHLLMQPTPILVLLFVMTCLIVDAQKKTHGVSHLVERVELQSQGCSNTSGGPSEQSFQTGIGRGGTSVHDPHIRINMKSPWVYADCRSVHWYTWIKKFLSMQGSRGMGWKDPWSLFLLLEVTWSQKLKPPRMGEAPFWNAAAVAHLWNFLLIVGLNLLISICS